MAHVTLAGIHEPETDVVVGNLMPTIRADANRASCLVQIYPSNTCIGRRTLVDRPLLLGREAGCDLLLDDTSVSRHHARLMPRDGRIYVADLKSTNGTFVNDAAARCRQLADGDYLRIGNHIFRFLEGGNIEADYHEEIYRMVITDALTGAHNKRHLLDFLARELTRARRHQRPLSLVMFDIDHFKKVNDTHGHLAGDAILNGLAVRLRQEIRHDELFARYGGEEFAVVMPEASLEQARQAAERLRRLAAADPFAYRDASLPITISLGVAATSGAEPMCAADFIGAADAHLYQAKQLGRNRVV